MKVPHILVVDDEREITDLIEIYLTNEGFKVTKRYDALNIKEDIAKNNISLVLLDVMMPGIDGLHALKMIRETFHIPVIIVSAKGTVDNKIEGLLSGADDYVTKPFDAMELVARVKSQLRRVHEFNTPVQDNSHIIEASDLRIDLLKKSVTVDGRPVALTRTEYEILILLAKEPGKIFSNQDIFEMIWHEKGTNSNNTIMVHIRKLREKIERQPRNPRHIMTVWGIGYRFDL